MRPSLCSRCLAPVLQLLNFFHAFLGISLAIYSAWMLSKWNVSGVDSLPEPWFIDVMLAAGVSVFAIAGVGHIAAESVVRCWLCCYAALMYVLIMIEASVLAITTFNTHWREYLPVDHTGELDKLTEFIKVNAHFFKWVSAAVALIQVLSLLLALILRSMALTENYEDDSDDEIMTLRAPLLCPHFTSTLTEVNAAEIDVNSEFPNTVWREKRDSNESGVSNAQAEEP